mmetsp:Transcript_97929/g.146887  ORF Transcript_97929/g.146887 Transcript_97929/m.146887 type:complete len:221 (+) Transcript_97929:66-728(+)
MRNPHFQKMNQTLPRHLVHVRRIHITESLGSRTDDSKFISRRRPFHLCLFIPILHKLHVGVDLQTEFFIAQHLSRHGPRPHGALGRHVMDGQFTNLIDVRTRPTFRFGNHLCRVSSNRDFFVNVDSHFFAIGFYAKGILFVRLLDQPNEHLLGLFGFGKEFDQRCTATLPISKTGNRYKYISISVKNRMERGLFVRGACLDNHILPFRTVKHFAVRHGLD